MPSRTEKTRSQGEDRLHTIEASTSEQDDGEVASDPHRPSASMRPATNFAMSPYCPLCTSEAETARLARSG